jgi:hypothetical protein
MSPRFRTKGPVQEDELHLYVERDEDGKLVTSLRQGNYAAVIGARQMGKTSLLYKLRRDLLSEGHIPIYFDLSPAKDRDRSEWYGYLWYEMQEQLRRIIPNLWLPSIKNQLDFRIALREMSLALGTSNSIAILLDEVSAVPRDVAESFFSTIRAIFTERELNREFQRYVFVMAGAFIPEELVKDRAISPFNIANRIYLSDADLAGVTRLVDNLEGRTEVISDEVINRIYHWTGGHLYFTQCICSIIDKLRSSYLTTELVDRAKDAIIASDENIARLYEKLNEDNAARKAIRDRILGRNKVLFRSNPLEFSRSSSLVARLELMGVIKCGSQGNCEIRNGIYEEALNHYFASRSGALTPGADSLRRTRTFELRRTIRTIRIAMGVAGLVAILFGTMTLFTKVDPEGVWWHRLTTLELWLVGIILLLFATLFERIVKSKFGFDFVEGTLGAIAAGLALGFVTQMVPQPLKRFWEWAFLVVSIVVAILSGTLAFLLQFWVEPKYLEDSANPPP